MECCLSECRSTADRGRTRRIGLLQIHNNRETNFGQKRDEHGWTEWKIRGQTSTKRPQERNQMGEEITRPDSIRRGEKGFIYLEPLFTFSLSCFTVCTLSRPQLSQENLIEKCRPALKTPSGFFLFLVSQNLVVRRWDSFFNCRESQRPSRKYGEM